MKKSLWGASLAAPLLLSYPTFAQVKSPMPGIYSFQAQFRSRNGTCPNFYGIAYLTFNGLSATRMEIRLPQIQSNDSVYVSKQTLTIRRGLGSKRISGAVYWSNSGLNPPPLDVSGSFDANLIFTGRESFVIDISEDFSFCHQEFISALVLTGH